MINELVSVTKVDNETYQVKILTYESH